MTSNQDIGTFYGYNNDFHCLGFTDNAVHMLILTSNCYTMVELDYSLLEQGNIPNSARRLALTTSETTKFIKCVSRKQFMDHTETTLLAEYLTTKDLVWPKSYTKLYWGV
ncbi:unnamed protein product [Meganyctiphanes norvegica]|uniref:Uncharacterized protein n=1 Tax=Meganyctiphanes norvegica TaxID=48144 RepID=A0AAV2QY22_MEGNR